MHSVFYYLLGSGAFILVLGGAIAVIALRNAPEGFEDENGFVGATKGDEVLLQQYSHREHYPVHHSADLAA